MVTRSETRAGTLPFTSVTSTREGELTLFCVRGDATPSALLGALRDFLLDPTRLVLWDMRGCQMARLDHDQLRRLVGGLMRSDHSKRPRGKSALVCRTDNDRAVASLLVAYAEASDYRAEMAVFGSVAQARHWLAADSRPE